MKQYPYAVKASSSPTIATNDAFNDIVAEHFTASPKLLETLRSQLAIKKLKASEMLWQSDAVQDKLYFLSKGLMYAYFITRNGKSVCKEIYWERDLLFCFRSLLSGLPYPFSVAALETSELYEISKKAYLQWVEQNQEHRDFHLSVISEYYMYKEGKEEFLLLNTPEQRVRKFYQTYPDLVKRVPQHIIASYLGITPISFSRIKKRIFV